MDVYDRWNNLIAETGVYRGFQRKQKRADNDNLAVEAARTLAENWDALT